MRRRDVIAGLGGAAAGWPFAVHAQQQQRVRRVGMLISGTENDQTMQALIAAFREGLVKLGWVEGRNLRIDLRFGGDRERMRAYAAELVSLAPEVIVTIGGPAARVAQQQTQTVPIVFALVGDALANGIVKSVARPEGNTTGITNRFASIGGKLVELLKEAVPTIERVGFIYNSQVNSDDNPQFRLIEEAARAFAIQAMGIPYRNAVALVHGIDAFAAVPNGSLIVLAPPPPPADRETIVELAAQHRLPVISESMTIAAEGVMMAYGSNEFDPVRRASSYVDRILRGAKVSELPVEYPTKFQLVVNLKTAKAIGLVIPESFLVRADEVIE